MTNAQQATLEGQLRRRASYTRHGRPAPGSLSTAQIAKRVGVSQDEVRKLLKQMGGSQ